MQRDGDRRDEARLTALRRQVRALERGAADGSGPAVPLGAAALDRALPGGGLAAAALHEVQPARAEWDDGAAAGFCLVLAGRLLARRAGPLVWIARRGDLYAPGLVAFGLDPGRLLQVRAGDEAAVLWAVEETLRAPAAAAVVGEVAALDRVAGRRLQLAAEAGGTPGLLLQRRRAAAGGREGPSGAATRWRLAALASDAATAEALPPGLPGAAGAAAEPPPPGRARWRAELVRCRGGAPGDFLLEWDDATGDLAVAAALRDGAPATDGDRAAL